MFEGIPPNELNDFRKNIKVFTRGANIILEGDKDDLGLFLLRKGKVSVFKGIGRHRTKIAEIEAINFFGEMALINPGPRTASVEAASENVVLYSIHKPDLNKVLTNVRWSSLLVSRLSDNLHHMNEQFAETSMQNKVLDQQLDDLQVELKLVQREYDYFRSKTAEVLGTIIQIQEAMTEGAVISTKEWKYMKSLVELTTGLAYARLPSVVDELKFLDREEWEKLCESLNVSELLCDYICDCIDKNNGEAK